MTPDLLNQLRWRSLRSLNRDFWTLLHPHQDAPDDADWMTWLLLGGRGAGKTRLGAEWVRALANGIPPHASRPHRRIALIGETEHDAREVMIEGPSGLLRVSPPWQRPRWISSRRRLEWPNGAVGEVFSADDPEQLRGPQFEAAWLDELAKWRHAEATFDMLQFGLRLGERPRQVITTTPRPTPLIKRLAADPRTLVSTARTRDNGAFLSPMFVGSIAERYAGTRLGRQELDGEIIDDRPDALWSRAMIETARVPAAPLLRHIVVGIDPPASAGKNSDACGLVAAGHDDNGVAYVIADESIAGLSPQGWATRAVALWRRLEADLLLAEVNQGGDMVRAVIRAVDPHVPVAPVRATRSKYLRAEPIAQLYEQGKVKHAGAFPALEDEMCDFGLNGLSSGRSPDRLDAMVYAVTALTHGRSQGPRIRVL